MSTTAGHVVAMPYPGRGHVNPMLNLCKLLSSKNPQLGITFVVTEEWCRFLSSEALPHNISFGTIPQVIPSEVGRAADFYGFLQATVTNMEAPFEQLLDRLDPPATAIIYDTYLLWMVGVGNRRNIPVASLFTMSASVFSTFFHFELLIQKGHFPVQVSERGDELVDYIPGLPTTSIANLPTVFHGEGQKCLNIALNAASSVLKAQYLLLTSIHEFESQVIDALKSKFSIPIYSIGPMIPYLKLKGSPDPDDAIPDQSYFQWLDAQSESSVLYISMGSFLSVSADQMEEIIFGIKESGIRFMWVARGDSDSLRRKLGVSLDMGCLVPWCDQLKVLCHPSIGGFWTHCGWNSTCEAIYAGVPMLTFPIFFDQVPDSKMIVDDWKIGWRVREKMDSLVTRKEIAEKVKNFMDGKREDRKEMLRRVKHMQEICRAAMTRGSTASDLNAFLQEISCCKPKVKPLEE